MYNKKPGGTDQETPFISIIEKICLFINNDLDYNYIKIRQLMAI